MPYSRQYRRIRRCQVSGADPSQPSQQHFLVSLIAHGLEKVPGDGAADPAGTKGMGPNHRLGRSGLWDVTTRTAGIHGGEVDAYVLFEFVQVQFIHDRESWQPAEGSAWTGYRFDLECSQRSVPDKAPTEDLEVMRRLFETSCGGMDAEQPRRHL